MQETSIWEKQMVTVTNDTIIQGGKQKRDKYKTVVSKTLNSIYKNSIKFLRKLENPKRLDWSIRKPGSILFRPTVFFTPPVAK